MIGEGRAAHKCKENDDLPDLIIDDKVCECEEDYELDLSYNECDKRACDELEDKELRRSLKSLICECKKIKKGSDSNESSDSDTTEEVSMSDSCSGDSESDSSDTSSESDSGNDSRSINGDRAPLRPKTDF